MTEEIIPMKLLSPKIHGVLDYVVVVVFLAAPTLLGLHGIPAMLSYALSAIHLALTLVTDFQLGVVRLIPLPIHGWIELVVGTTLVASPWVLRFAAEAPARLFYVAAGVVIVLTWLITDYRGGVPSGTQS